MTDLSKAEQELVEQLGDFVKLFVHKGEDGDDPPEKWAWTIRGSFPTEVMLWIRSHTDALILAAYETCAKWLKEHGNVMFNGINLADGIRSLAPEAARAALERIEAEARLEGAKQVSVLLEGIEFDFGVHKKIHALIAALTAAAKETP